MRHYLIFFRRIIVFFSLAFIISISGCKENTVDTENLNGSVSTRDELTDPKIKPEVIWTFPAHNGVGPYTAFNTNSHHFVVQFNKLMNLYSIKSSSVKIKGFVPKAYFSLTDGSYSNQQYQNVLKFYIRNSTTGSSMNFEVGKTYTVEIDSTVEDIHGNRMVKNHSFSFTPEPSLRVRDTSPANGDTANFNDYYSSNRIVLSFNSALTSSSLSSLKINPTVNGKWTLDQSNPSIAYFTPTIGFSFMTQYQISADQGMSDKYGNVLPQPFLSTFTTSPFTVLTTSPADGSENVYIYSGTSISLALSGQIEPATVNSAFSITPAIQGNLNASGNQISFNSNEQLLPGTKYTVSLATTLLAKNGTPLSSPYSFSFTTDEFRVNNTEPYQGTSSVSPNTQIRFTFNSTIDQASALSAFSIKPSVNGNFSFSNSDNRTFVFIPTQPLQYGTQYTVTISSSMKSVGGVGLKDPYELQFTTTPFQVYSTTPSNNSYNTSENYIAVSFTGDLDTGSVRNSFSITPATAGNFTFYTNQFLFTPSKPLSAGKKYTVTLSTGIKGKDGSSLQSPYTFSFTTTPFQITNYSPGNGSTNVYRSTSIYIYTNQNVNQSSATTAFSISPTVAGNIYTNGNSFYFTPQSQFAPNTTYIFTVSTKLKSINGDTLLFPQSSSFKTGS